MNALRNVPRGMWLAALLLVAFGAGCNDSTTPGVLFTVAVIPTPVTLAGSATQQFTAQGKDIGGTVIPITPTWTVAAGGGTISATGLFTAGTTAGTFSNTVKATSGSISGTATVTVTAGPLATIAVTPNPATVPLQGTQQFTAVGKDASGNVVSTTPTWSVAAGGGTISATGLFTAGATTGTFTNTVVATSGSVSGTATVNENSTATGGGTGTGSGHGPAPVPLGMAGNYVILGQTTITNTGTSAITGDLGLYPNPASFITGFALTEDASTQFSTSALVTGKVYAADYTITGTPPGNLATASTDETTAYTTAAGRTLPDYTELGAGNIGGLTLAPGLYKWSTTVLIPTSVTLSGSANDTWIFQIAGGLTQSSATSVILTGGALAQNVVWQVAGIVTIGTTATMNGEVMSQTQINLDNAAVANGRLLAQTQVTLISNTIIKR